MTVATVMYKLCPRYFRAVPLKSEKLYCSNDRETLLERCPYCASRVRTPYARFCVNCGLRLGHGPLE